MITLNAPTSYAYVLLRKNSGHYRVLNERMEHSIDRGGTLRLYVRAVNSRNIWNVGDVFPDPERIDYDMIAQLWDVNLPMNNPQALLEMGVRAERYTGKSG